jgi:DNA-binding LacI/PurR family transcriptional regulator
LIASFPELSPDEVISKYVSPLNMKENYGQNEDTIMQHGYLRTAELLKQFPDTRGIYYSSDELLLGGLRYLREQHIVPGKDILLAGFNNIPAVRNSGLPISSAAHDIDLLAMLLNHHVEIVGLRVVVFALYRRESLRSLR